ncbi:hypothetical protein [Fibrivirga algicola]|uniref:Lipoprotein n=1 Tax=Fibrivirga algicola TaxID=2950420 RepID=A0ABX0QMJ7_9BACT|nr:hypothetical protein [Fibrivirga algicola]NID13721.1 hypothetical protein [Fibrivirga algicola]
MISRFVSTHTYSLLGGLLLFVLCCSCNKASKESTTSAPASVTALTDTSSAVLPAETHFYSLTLASTYFQDPQVKRSNLMFSYLFSNEGLTLEGWKLDKQNGSFGSATPVRELMPTPVQSTSLTIESNTRLGNLAMKRQLVTKIHNAVSGKNAILFFTPSLVTIGSPPTVRFEVQYTITIKEVKQGGALQVIDFSELLNPAPPHQAFD